MNDRNLLIISGVPNQSNNGLLVLFRMKAGPLASFVL